MSFPDAGNTETAIDQINPKVEQQNTVGVDTSDQDYTPSVQQPQPTPEPEPEAPVIKEDPRQAKEREIIERANRDRADENERSQASLSRPEPAAPVADAAPSDDAYVDLKVRKQPYRMTVKDRNELLSEDYEDADIREMSERDKNRHAQMIVARNEYSKELKEIKEKVNSAARPEPVPQAQPVAAEPVEVDKTPVELANEKYDAALEAFEFGEEGAKEKLAIAQSELLDAKVDAATSKKLESQNATRQEQVFAADVQNGVNDANKILREQSPSALADPIIRETLPAYYDTGYRTLIAKVIDSSKPEIQQAFAQNGVTPEALANLRGPNLMKLYQDMTIKGYKLPQPSVVMRAVAGNLASRFSGNTQTETAGQQPNPAPTSEALTAPVDRSGRKDALQKQPGRASVPQGQADAPRRQETQQERSKRVVQEEKQARRGKRK